MADDDIVRHIVVAQAKAAKQDRLAMWTVYDHPSDFPRGYVARRFEIGKGLDGPQPTDDVVGAGDLQQLRDSLRHAGLVCLTRNEGDEPQIVETWL